MSAPAQSRYDELYLDCVHCGLCISSCPTYRVLGNEMDSPRGRIYLMRAFDEGRAQITDTFSDHMFRCLDCRACETVCPSGVQFGHMMEEMRGKIVDERPANPLIRFVLNHLFPYPWRFQLASRLLGLYRQSGVSDFLASTGLLRRLAPAIADAEAMTPHVEFESGVVGGAVYPAVDQAVGRVALFSGCVMNSLLGEINKATVRLLQVAGFDVIVPEEQICCGALANHAGLRQTAASMATRNVSVFEDVVADAIIVNASGCGAMLTEYPLLIEGAEATAARVSDISSFLESTSIAQRLTETLNLRVGYDDPCHLLHALGVGDQPRALLGSIPGIEYVEVHGADECCGSAGIYNLTEPDLSREILDRKMERVAAANLDVLVTGNPGCLFQLQYGARRHGLKLEVVHLVELLDRAIDPELRSRLI